MKKSGATPLKVALFGMDPRAQKTMELYLKGPCRGIADVVSEADADIDIIDADFATAGEILSTRRELNPHRSIVLLSLQALKVENTYFVQKPVKADQLVSVLNKIKNELAASDKSKKAKSIGSEAEDKKRAPEAESPVREEQQPDAVKQEQAIQAPVKKRKLFEDNEGGYAVFLGTLSGIDFDDPDQLRHASFDPRRYLLSYVFSAYKVATHENRSLQLNSVWKPLVILPDSRQIWLDADDKQLRAFAGVEQSKMFVSNINLASIDGAAFRESKDGGSFQDMDVFIWKLAVWTSKGRFPLGLEPNHPVYLKYWPNFTRLLLTPEALRIAALLLQGPRTPLDIIKVLNIKPQYVFAFISACHSLGILGRSERRVDELIAPEPPRHSKKQGLLSKILHKLRGD